MFAVRTLVPTVKAEDEVVNQGDAVFLGHLYLQLTRDSFSEYLLSFEDMTEP